MRQLPIVLALLFLPGCASQPKAAGVVPALAANTVAQMEEEIARVLIDAAVSELLTSTGSRAEILARHAESLNRNVDTGKVNEVTRSRIALLNHGAEWAAGRARIVHVPEELIDEIETNLAALEIGSREATEPGRDIQALLDQAGDYVFSFDAVLSQVTSFSPATDLEIRVVEPERAATAWNVSYVGPATNNDAGICYLNLTHIPTAELEAAVYACTIPGHHLIPAVPLNLVVPVNAYSEGWALYSTTLPYELGFYAGSDARHGQQFLLARALTAALVDIGINSNGWSREKAISEVLTRLPLDPSRAAHLVDTVLANAGAASTGVMGYLHFRKLRQESEQALGPGFNAKDFHDQVLKFGPLPLPLVEQNVQDWLRSQTDMAK